LRFRFKTRSFVVRIFFAFGLLLALQGCKSVEEGVVLDEPKPQVGNERGGGASFKVPVPPGYDWGMSQSWAEHCAECDRKYPSENEADSYCNSSHTDNCCRYGYDFNLPGISDQGVEVLATAGGRVQRVQSDDGWGNYVILDHGDNVCSRYAHMEAGSTNHLSEGQEVCQGFVVGTIGSSGFSTGPHLHFQFQHCDSRVGFAKGFTDGNGVPKCTSGEDRYDDSGRYSFLRLNNQPRQSCDGAREVEDDRAAGGRSEPFNGGGIQNQGWAAAECGELPRCPMNDDCRQGFDAEVSDLRGLDSRVRAAANYLWGECALEGRFDGQLAPREPVTRTEALKIVLTAYGLMRGCRGSVPFDDVDREEWFYDVVACGVDRQIISTDSRLFRPYDNANFAEAAKMAVEAMRKKRRVRMADARNVHFPRIAHGHWSIPYLETLYNYGALTESSLTHAADDSVERQEFLVMAAGLSPCFCGSVECDSGCQCDQNALACEGEGRVVEAEEEPEADVAGDPEPEDEPEEFEANNGGDPDAGPEEEEEPEYVPRERNFVLEGVELETECHYVDYKTDCFDDTPQLYVRCEVTMHSDEVIEMHDYLMEIVDEEDFGDCVVTDARKTQVDYGAEPIEPGVTIVIGGHYELLCTAVPHDGLLDVAFTLVQRVGGVNLLYDGRFLGTVAIDDQPFEHCEEHEERECQELPCDMLPFECGNYYDSCNIERFCGMCPEGMLCNRNFCEAVEEVPEERRQCQPLTCFRANYSCGLTPDRCGDTLDCGSCERGFSCVEHNCEEEVEPGNQGGGDPPPPEPDPEPDPPPPPPCEPLQCDLMVNNCGRLNDGCGGSVDCGECRGAFECRNNRCMRRNGGEEPGCDRQNTCHFFDQECGFTEDLCNGDVRCGYCRANEVCDDGQCR
jgi:hypothetical protein